MYEHSASFLDAATTVLLTKENYESSMLRKEGATEAGIRRN